ncbi:hypothetical protein GOODEAATRI_012585 [Goodea atripinnis]|uniref:Uncharacterized protein n=1 Tax=Goodea atripinnis TaxID=208336 RepID=A0ABV0MRJ1_9TELE
MEDRKCNYERYRGLVQNDFANSECLPEVGQQSMHYTHGPTVMLKKDKEEVEAIKHAKALEAEKAMYSGRRSRRQRREFLSIFIRPETESSSESRSRSCTPGPEKITFITSFGGSEDEAAPATQTAVPHSGHAPSSLQHSAGHSRGSRSRSSSRLGGGLRQGAWSSRGHRRRDSGSRSPSHSPNRPPHSPSPTHRGSQPAANTISDKLRK